MDKPLTPEEFAEQMMDIAESDRYDQYSGHVAGDDLMCDLLKSLGYEEGVQWFESMDKWYA